MPRKVGAVLGAMELSTLRRTGELAGAAASNALTPVFREERLHDLARSSAHDNLIQFQRRKPLATRDFLAWLRDCGLSNIGQKDMMQCGWTEYLEQKDYAFGAQSRLLL